MFCQRLNFILKLKGMDDFFLKQQVESGWGFISKKNKKICPI